MAASQLRAAATSYAAVLRYCKIAKSPAIFI
jgi:hypothetical protein